MLLSTSTRMVLGRCLTSGSGSDVPDDGVSHVPDGVGDGVSSEQHDVTGDLLDPSTSYASSLLHAIGCWPYS